MKHDIGAPPSEQLFVFGEVMLRHGRHFTMRLRHFTAREIAACATYYKWLVATKARRAHYHEAFTTSAFSRDINMSRRGEIAAPGRKCMAGASPSILGDAARIVAAMPQPLDICRQRRPRHLLTAAILAAGERRRGSIANALHLAR